MVSVKHLLALAAVLAVASVARAGPRRILKPVLTIPCDL